MPAVQAAREAARRAQCSNNQKQISLAMLNYEAGRRKLPSLQNSLVGYATGVSWGVVILPFLDRVDLWNVWKSGGSGQRFLRITWCPSDPPTSNSATDTPCSYTANGLVIRNALYADTTTTPATYPLQPLSLDYVNSHDGTATTLLLSENLRDDWYTSGSATYGWTDLSQCNVTFGYAGSTSTSQVFSARSDSTYSNFVKNYPNSMSPTPPSAPQTSPPFWFNVSSNHGSGVVAAYCDGHVSFLRSDVDGTAAIPGSTINYSSNPPIPSIWNALCTPDGATWEGGIDESLL